MSNKFFTFIYGNQVHAARKKKIIPASEISTLMEAYEILQNAKVDAEKYHLEISKECEQIKEHAYKDGYDEGYKQWTEHLLKLEEERNLAHKDLEQMVVPIALKAAKKMVGRELELSPNAIVDIVRANIKNVAQHKKIIIYVNKNEWEIIEQNKNRIKELFEDLQSLSIRPRDDVEPGGCVIETEIGIINAQMDHRWHALERAFDKLMKTTPESQKGSE
ncbi:MAG: HrpE/YscL family type III secretion apparatus protein [Chlamydiales bacterium]